MSKFFAKCALTLVATLLVGQPSAWAQTLVAGWDASQYVDDGLLSIDGATGASTLDANYSDLDPTFGAGAEAAAFGTLYYDGSFGSDSFTIDFSGSEAFVPASGSLVSNGDATSLIFGSAAAFAVLGSEGQAFTNDLGFLANGPVQVVFAADLSSTAMPGSNWTVSFGGRVLDAVGGIGTSDVTLEFSTDGASYSPLGMQTFNTTDTQYSFPLGAGTNGANQVFVRFGFAPSGVDLPVIDNVAITVPEPAPGAALLVVACTLLGVRAARGTKRFVESPRMV